MINLLINYDNLLREHFDCHFYLLNTHNLQLLEQSLSIKIYLQ